MKNYNLRKVTSLYSLVVKRNTVNIFTYVQFILRAHMLISLLIFLLFSNAVTSRRDKSMLFSRIVIIGLSLISFLAYHNIYIKPLGNNLGIFGGLFNTSIFIHSFNIFILIISAIILTLTAFYPRKVFIKELSSLYSILNNKFVYNKEIISNKNGEQFRIIEYSLIIVFILCGAMFLISTADLISIFLAIELQSYGLYILCTLYRNSELSTASGLTYFLLGGLSSCFILFGSVLFYINSGTTNLDNIYIIANISEINSLPLTLYLYQPYYFNLCLIILFTGFLFKVSAAPFHFWSPDVYDGIPTIVTTYVAIVAKISIFAFLLQIVYYTNYDFFSFNWKNILVLSSLFSLIIGSVLGLTQSRIKRLFAYSTISHVGFILLALCINSTESIQSYIFYILQYSLSNLNVFIILISIGFSLYLYVYNEDNGKNSIARDNYSPIQLINQIKGYFYVNPFISISLAITIFSFVGIPPIIGFFAKQMILSAAIDNGYIFMALVAILTSVIGAGYYLNLVKQIFFFKSDYIINPKLENLKLTVYHGKNLPFKADNSLLVKQYKTLTIKPENITINSSLSISVSVITSLLILFIYTPEEWFNLITVITILLLKP